jgi:hypothetical protein
MKGEFMTNNMTEAQWQEVKQLASKHLGADGRVQRALTDRIRIAVAVKFGGIPRPAEATADFVCRVLLNAVQKAQAELKAAIGLPDGEAVEERVACATISHCDLLILYNLAKAFANTQSLYVTAALFCGLSGTDKLLDVVTYAARDALRTPEKPQATAASDDATEGQGLIQELVEKVAEDIQAESGWTHECVCEGVHVYTKTFSDAAECGKEPEEAGEEPKALPTNLDYLRAGTLTLAAYQEQAVGFVPGDGVKRRGGPASECVKSCSS